MKPPTALLYAGMVLILASPPGGRADIPLTQDQAIQAYGDFRMRFERDWNSQQADGTDRRNRERLRVRGRVGVKWQINEELLFNGRVRTGHADAQQSPHLTVHQNQGVSGVKGASIDKLFLQFGGDDRTLIVGRNALAIWQPHEFLWDDDVWVDGVSLAWRSEQQGGAKYGMNLVGAFTPDGDDDNAFLKRAIVGVGQLTYDLPLGQDLGEIKLATGIMAIGDPGDSMNAVVDDEDFLISFTNLQHNFTVQNVPVSLGGDFMHNFEDGPGGDIAADQTDGWDAYVLVGDLKKRGHVQFGYFYAEIEKWAVPRFFAQDDWFRFGSATQTRASDYRGHEIRGGIALAPNVNVVAKYFFVDTISTGEDGNRFRVDVNISF